MINHGAQTDYSYCLKISLKLTISVFILNINVVVLQPCTFLGVLNTLKFGNEGGFATLIVP